MGKDYIESHERSKLCKEAIREERAQGFISVSTAEIDCSRGFVDFDEVTISLEKFLNRTQTTPDLTDARPIQVIYVCGLDHFNKCSHVAYLAKEKNIACAVIYRHGASDDHIQRMRHSSSNIYYIPLGDNQMNLNDISSTAIRKHYQNGDYTSLGQLTYSSVVRYYQQLPGSKSEQY